MSESPAPAGVHAGTLAAAAADLAALAAEAAPELAPAAAELADRLAAGRFHISVVGEFKRGKSTLVNALLGRALLPTGVLPLTAVPIEVAHGPEAAVVETRTGERLAIGLDQLWTYATEEGNPGNERAVARVRVSLPADLLAPGAVLVDTPGLASVHAHNTAAAQAAISATDGAVVVLSADAPLSERERDLLALLRQRSARTFFVLNRADHLAAQDLRRVQAFVTGTLRDLLGRPVEVYPLSASRALAAAAGEGTPEQGFGAFARDLRAFVEDGLAAARDEVACRDLRSLADRVDAAVALEAAALELTVEEVTARLERFGTAADAQRKAFAEDRLLLAHAVDAIAAGAAARLRAATAEQPAGAAAHIAAVSGATLPGRLEQALDDAVAGLVREHFERLRPSLLAEVEDAWQAAAADFRSRVEQRAGAVRRAAEDAFDRPLPPLGVPAVRAATDGFSYHLERLPRTGEGVARALRRLLPPTWQRRRLERRAQRRLASELDKHAGRLRADVARRLADAHEAFAATLAAYLDELALGITAAARRAQARRSSAGAQLSAERRRVAGVARRTDAVRRAAGHPAP